MKRRMIFLILFITVLCFDIAFSAGSYRFTDAYEDAETVRSYFNGTGSEAEAKASFERLYSFWYKDAQQYVLNKNKGKFHYPDCKSVTEQMKEENKVFITCSREMLISLGYSPCGNCHP